MGAAEWAGYTGTGTQYGSPLQSYCDPADHGTSLHLPTGDIFNIKMEIVIEFSPPLHRTQILP